MSNVSSCQAVRMFMRFAVPQVGKEKWGWETTDGTNIDFDQRGI
jgi:hypothetical protein